MATDGSYALRVPASLMEDIRSAAIRDGASLNGFIVQAVAEKVAMLRARGSLHGLTPDEQAEYLEKRAARAAPDLAAILAKAGHPGMPLPDDAVPEGWLASPSGKSEAGHGTR